MRVFLIPFVLLTISLSFIYIVCLKCDLIDYFVALLAKMGSYLGARGVTHLLVKLCLSGGLASLIGVSLQLLFLGESPFLLYMDNPAQGWGQDPQDQPFPPAEGGEIPSGGQPDASSSAGPSMNPPEGPYPEKTPAPNPEPEGSAESPSAPSALEERENELLSKNLAERKCDLAEGENIDSVRTAVEGDFHSNTKTEKFQLIQQLFKETQSKTEDCPATKSSLNEIKNYSSKIQDGRGGRKPSDGVFES